MKGFVDSIVRTMWKRALIAAVVEPVGLKANWSLSPAALQFNDVTLRVRWRYSIVIYFYVKRDCALKFTLCYLNLGDNWCERLNGSAFRDTFCAAIERFSFHTYTFAAAYPRCSAVCLRQLTYLFTSMHDWPVGSSRLWAVELSSSRSALASLGVGLVVAIHRSASKTCLSIERSETMRRSHDRRRTPDTWIFSVY